MGHNNNLVAIPKWGVVLIPIIITLLNSVGTPRSFYLVVIWILFENVMSLHRTKATFIGLFETGRVNEWVVTEKLGNASKGTSKPLITHRFKFGERLLFLELSVGVFLLICGTLDFAFGQYRFVFFLKRASQRSKMCSKGVMDLVCVVCLLLHDLIMNRGFMDVGGRNNNHRKKTTTDTGTSSALGSDGILNDATPRVDAAIKVVSPSVVEETVAMKCPVLNTPGVVPNPPPPTQEANAPTVNALGKPFYAIATGKPSGKKVNACTLYTPGGNGIDVVVPVDSIRAINENILKEDVSTVPVWVKLHGVPVTAFSEDGLSAIANKLGTPLILDSYTSDMCMQSWGRSSYARIMIELRADVELKDKIVMAMPKTTREGHYTCNVRVEYEWKPPRCSSCKVFGHIHEECLKNTGVDEKKTVKKPSQTSRGVSKGVEPTIEVSNSNQFDVLNSVDNDVEFGTNGGTTNLLNNEDTSNGSSFMNINNDGEFASHTPIVSTGIVESVSEVKVVFDETANLRISTSDRDGSDKGYCTNSLLEQLRDSYSDNDDYDSYDDDMYENHDLSEHLQSICDDLDITVRIHNYWRGLEGSDRTRVLCFPTDGGDLSTWEVVDIRPVPSGLLFKGWLATTWDFFGFRPIFKDTEGNVVTMFEYLRFPFLSGASILKGPALTSQDQIEQHTTRPFSSNQNISEKTDHQKRVEVEDPKIVATRERKARAAAKKREKRRQGGGGDGDGGEGSHPATKRRKTIARKDGPDASEATSSSKPLRTVNPTDLSGAVAEIAEYPIATQSASPSRSIQRGNVDEGESSRGGALYVPDWSIHQRCRLDTPTWLDLAHSSNLYTTLADRYKAMKGEHEGCVGKLKVLKNQSSELSQVNKDQALRIKELEGELAKKDFSFVYAERITIQVRRGKGLNEERSEKDLTELMSMMENFDAYADKKMYVEYDKLFEKQHRHAVSDLLKVYPNSPPSRQDPPSKPSFEKVPSTSALDKS
uniref:Nucleotide-diphospho-sugar transferase n=1 Tax=Tanacetum cinerariifolium TaxID=118510 RepID=A0A6L2K2H6_TANCI|nr:nucleotide-diphospho-sugar transferase [Tanacetum cinerariifolium]